jgi:hypothetical protein
VELHGSRTPSLDTLTDQPGEGGILQIRHRQLEPPKVAEQMRHAIELDAGEADNLRVRTARFGMTLRHYVDPAIKAEVDAQRVDAVLAKIGGVALEEPAPRLCPTQKPLRSLSSDERGALLQALLVEHSVQ